MQTPFVTSKEQVTISVVNINNNENHNTASVCPVLVENHNQKCSDLDNFIIHEIHETCDSDTFHFMKKKTHFPISTGSAFKCYFANTQI